MLTPLSVPRGAAMCKIEGLSGSSYSSQIYYIRRDVHWLNAGGML